MKVTSNKNLSFPGLKWGINKGEEKELPKDKEAQEAILAHSAISEVGKSQEEKTTPKVEGGDKKSNNNSNKE